MYRSRICLVVGFLCLWTLPAGLQAQQKNKLSQFVPFRRVEADPNKEYALTINNGPWMIMVASFAGPSAESEAAQLVLELRKRFRIPAYVYRKDYDFTDSVRGLGLDRYGEPKKMRYRRAMSFEEIAVMAGNFPAVNDPGMQKALQAIKYAQPQSLAKKGKPSAKQLSRYRNFLKKVSGDKQRKAKGPLGSAFITRNPMLPEQYFVPQGVDKMVSDMNSGVKHSLMDCPGKYSVKVATFRGNVVIDQKEVQRIESTGRMESRLAEAGEKAHVLVEMLRKRGVEAYEFHDRHESIVTVGSFDEVGRPRKDGKIEINPAVHKIIRDYGAHQQQLPGQQSGLMPRSLNGISFDIQPTAVAVPQRSIAADYRR